MKIKAFILVLFTGGFLLNACQKNTDIFVPDPGQLNGPDTSWQAVIAPSTAVSVLKNNLLQAPYQDSFTVNANIASITTPFGLQLNFPPNSCANALGQPVTGKVQVELMAVNKKGDMISLNRPSTYNDSMLVTAGEIFIKLKKEGQPVVLAPNVRINIHYVDLPVNSQMNFFIGDESNPDHYNWLPNTDTANKLFFSPQAYEIYTNHLGWVSLAYQFNLNSTASINVSADIASYFTNANTIAFTVFKDFRSVVAMNPDLGTHKFITGKLPVGKQITVVVISKLGDDYYLGYESAVTQAAPANQAAQQVHIVPVKKSLPEILSYLSTL